MCFPMRITHLEVAAVRSVASRSLTGCGSEQSRRRVHRRLQACHPRCEPVQDRSSWGVAARPDRAVRQHTWAPSPWRTGLASMARPTAGPPTRARGQPRRGPAPLDPGSTRGSVSDCTLDGGYRRDGRSHSITHPGPFCPLPPALADHRRRCMRHAPQPRDCRLHRCSPRTLPDDRPLGCCRRDQHGWHGALDLEAGRPR